MENSNEHTEIELAAASPTTPNERREIESAAASPTTPNGRREIKSAAASPAASNGRHEIESAAASPAASNGRREIESAGASPTTRNGRREIETPAPQIISNAGDELSWKKLLEYTTIDKNLSSRIGSLQKSAFTLANYYFISQAVVFTALSSNSSLVCHDVWFPLFVSLLPGAFNLFAFFKIGQEYIETMISQKDYKKMRRDHEVRISGRALTQLRDDENTKIVEKKEKERLTGILYTCMCAVGLLAAVIAVGSSWMLCGESAKPNAKCVKLCQAQC